VGFCCEGRGGGPNGCAFVVAPLVAAVVAGFESASDAGCSGGWTGSAFSSPGGEAARPVWPESLRTASSLEALFLSWGDILLELGRDGSFVGLLSTSAIAVT
jgi:hypothetical protein